MIDRPTRRQIPALLAAGVAGGLVLSRASAAGADASPWSHGSHSALRLMAGGEGRAPGSHLAAIAIRMNAGFKTYWRHPGDSGVPPVFRFDGSENLRRAEVHFPAPVRFPDGAGGFSSGYLGETVLFPVTVTPLDPALPVRLKLAADYAVCEKMCIPASGQAELTLSPQPGSPHRKAILAAVARVPVVARLGEEAGLAIVNLRKGDAPEHFLIDAPEHFLIDIRAAQSHGAPTLFIEGEEPWFFEPRAAQMQPGGAGVVPVAVIERSKAADCTGADIVMTLAAHDRAIEVATRLDLFLVTP